MKKPRPKSLKKPWRRACAAAKRIPARPDPQHAQRIHAWAEFVKSALRDEDAQS